MPLRTIKHQLTCLFELTSDSSLIGGFTVFWSFPGLPGMVKTLVSAPRIFCFILFTRSTFIRLQSVSHFFQTAMHPSDFENKSFPLKACLLNRLFQTGKVQTKRQQNEIQSTLSKTDTVRTKISVRLMAGSVL